MTLRRWNAALLLAVAAACGRSDAPNAADAGGTLIVASGADADAILPPLVRTTVGKMISDQIFEPLAEINDSLNVLGDAGFTPRLASSWTWAADSMSIAFSLNPDARWQDGKPVRAEDVQLSFALLTDPAIGAIPASSLASVDSIVVRDSLTAVAWFKRRSPEQFFDLVYNLRIMPSHRLSRMPREQLAASPEASSPVGSGRFRFVRWERGSTIEIEADTANYRGRPLLDRVIVSVSPDPNAAITSVLAGEADFIEVLRGDAVERIRDNPNARPMNMPSYDYGVLQWNLRDRNNEAQPHPILGDRNVRRALAMGIDRAAVVQSVLDTLGLVAHGPFVRAQSFADPDVKGLPFNMDAARALLDSAGWRDADGDGVREKNGRPLQLELVVPTSSSTRMRMSVILQEQLKQLGVRLTLDQVEANVFGERVFATRRWDGFLMGWHPDPGSSALTQSWSGRNAKPGGSNLSRYASAGFDAHLDSARSSSDAAARRAHFRQAFDTLNEDAPAVFLYELRVAVGVHHRVQPKFRPDAWWAHLDEWSIPTDQRIARDRVGLSAAR